MSDAAGNAAPIAIGGQRTGMQEQSTENTRHHPLFAACHVFDVQRSRQPGGTAETDNIQSSDQVLSPVQAEARVAGLNFVTGGVQLDSQLARPPPTPATKEQAINGYSSNVLTCVVKKITSRLSPLAA